MNSEVQQVSQICNNLQHLIPVGTILVYGLESFQYGYEGISTDRSGWKWLDPWFLESCIGDEGSQHIQALSKLLSFKFFVATYKRTTHPILNRIAPSTGSRPTPLCKVRLYAVPNDIDGARFLKSWRSRLASEASLQKIHNVNWSTLREITDFSAESWEDSSNGATVVIVSLRKEGSLRHTSPEALHTKRWLEGLPHRVSATSESVSLDTVVRRVYDSIRSPDLSPYLDKKYRARSEVPTSEETIKGLINLYFTNQFPIHGITSTLYPFQLHSVCKMFEKESVSQREPVPNFLEVLSPMGQKYFVDMFTMSFYSRPELFLLPKGGILAENMGLGKTLISLALICLTKHQFSKIPQDAILHENQSLEGTLNEELHETPTSPKSLWEICRETISQESLPWKYYENDLPMSVIDKLRRRPGFFKMPHAQLKNRLGPRGRHAATIEDQYRVLYLCHTTLVIVPENLLHQWHTEMLKHVKPNFLKALFVSSRFEERIEASSTSYRSEVPSSPRELIQYDLVVISIPMFLKSHRSSECVFQKIHWKRLIIDEGHSMGHKTTNLSSDCKSLSCERTWAVTGTPTTGLTNLHMNEEEQDLFSHSSKKKRYTVKNSFSVKDDLARLGTIAAHFLKIEPFHSQPRLWNTVFIKNLTSANFSTERSLSKLLKYILIRHSLPDVERDLKLPQLHHEAVYLDPSYQNKLAINLFTAVLAVNAISSEREGSDYMFDPVNHSQLRKLISNLQLATFYWTGFKQQDVEGLVKIAEHCLKKVNSSGEPHYNSFDRNLLKKSIRIAIEALHNPRWRFASALHEMLYYVEGLPSSFIKHFGLKLDEHISLFGAPQLTALQKFFYKNRFLSMEDDEVLESKLKESSGPFWDRYWSDLESKEKKIQKRHSGMKDDDVRSEATFMDATSDPEIENMRSKQNIEKARAEFANGNDQTKSSGKVSDFSDATILGSASTKLSYLATRLVENQRAGLKSIVFFEYEDSAYYLSEFLDIIGVKYILYATFVGSSQRSNNLIEFDHHDASIDGGIALIMDLRLAAHGLTVISATRVYFMSPVWHRSREAQAIKRAHRIGQTQEVYVETLVLRGTLEEQIYMRRTQDQEDANKGSKHEMIDDSGMQNYFLSHEFLATSEMEPEHAPFIVPAHDEQGNISNDESMDGVSLSSHIRTKKRLDGVLYDDWTVRLFTRENLEKLNSALQQKPTKAQSNQKLLSSSPDRKRVHENPKSNESKKRRVRFR